MTLPIDRSILKVNRLVLSGVYEGLTNTFSLKVIKSLGTLNLL